MSTPGYPAQDLNWLVTNFVERVPYVAHATSRTRRQNGHRRLRDDPSSRASRTNDHPAHPGHAARRGTWQRPVSDPHGIVRDKCDTAYRGRTGH